MKRVISILILTLSSICFGQEELKEVDLSESIPLIEDMEGEDYEIFDVDFDWMLDVQTEVINGIWYSPTIEFNLNTKNGLNLQFQTAALPTLNGVRIHKVQPSAAVSIGYHF